MSSALPPLLRFSRFLSALWRRKWVRPGLSLLLALWLIGMVVAFVTDAQWFSVIGYGNVWRQKTLVQAYLFAVVAVSTFMLLAWPVRALTSNASIQLRVPDEYARLLHYLRLYQANAARYAWGFVAVIALTAGWSAAASWQHWPLFLHGPTYGSDDAFFHRDAGFYIFRLPFLQHLLGIAWRTVSVVLLLIGVLTIGHNIILLLAGRAKTFTFISKWLVAFAIVWFMLRAVGYYFARFALVMAQHENEIVPAGMTYVDWNVRRPLLWLGLVLCLLTGGLLILSQRSRRPRVLRRAILTTAIAAVFVPSILAWPLLLLVYWLVVAPDEFNAQQRFVIAHIQSTRSAWQLDEVMTEDVRIAPLSSATSREALAVDGSTPVWDTAKLLASARDAESLPSSRQFSTFVDRYKVDGTSKLVAVATRQTQRDTSSQSWIQRHVVAPSAEGPIITFYDPTRSTPGGEPQLLSLHSLSPPAPKTPAANAGILYGATVQDYALVTGEINGAVVLDTFWRRALWAWRLKDINLFLYSSRKAGTTSLVFRRSIQERAAQLAPFLQPAGEPYPIVAEGRTMWMLDLMSVTSRYPGAAVETVHDANRLLYNAARDSVKMVMDSSDGRVAFYVAQKQAASDPMLQAWQAAFPGLIRPWQKMPVSLREHCRYPRSLLVAQAKLLARYTASPQAFHSRQQQWKLWGDSSSAEGELAAAQYVLLPRPAAQQSTLVSNNRFVLQVLMMTPQSEIGAVLQAECDADNYGRLQLLRVRGNRFNAGALASLKQLVQPQAKGVQVEAGVPVPRLMQGNKSPAHLLLIQPFYTVAREAPRFPFGSDTATAPAKLWRVAVVDAAAPEMFGVGSNLNNAIVQLQRKITVTQAGHDIRLSPAQQALRAHDAAQAATRRGDWKSAGQWWQRERQILEKMAGASQPAEQ